MTVQVDSMTDSLTDAEPSLFGAPPSSSDPRGTRILARSIYRELRTQGLTEREVLTVATELLSLTATDLKASR